MAVILPFLLILAAGVVDFAQGWNLRQILANAARDGARLGADNSYLDLTYSSPQSIQDICQQVADYLIQANVNPSFMGISGTSASAVSSGCSKPNTTVSSSGAVTAATYYSTGSYGLKIEPMVPVPTGCGTTVTCMPATRVTLTYPFNWTMGTSLFASGSNSKIPIQVYSMMTNN